MAEIIDFAAKKAAEDRPDADCIRKDGYGREVFLFSISYRMGDADWGAELWAYSEDDAKNRVAAMRENLVYMGQVFAVIPA